MAFDFGKLAAAILIGGLSGTIMSGCTSASSPSQATLVNPGADRSSTYPDITAPVHAANQQMSNEEAQKISARVSSLAAQRRAGTISDAEYRRVLLEMDALAANHGPDALKEIQN